ncbi:MAG: InlB B-repeat-containing protein [Methanobrevibacter sp.]|nr:InlB B-repeat-containing protein [Methanobrevibacter sp.]
MKKLTKKLFIILVLSVFMISVMTTTTYAVNTGQEEKIVEYKEKKVTSYKVTWNANGGKIGSKKTVSTTVKKGSKLKKLATTPKRTGYTFKGWYTKKSGGSKISVNTKPTKNVTYFAQWKKKASSRVLNTEEKKLVGSWGENRGWLLSEQGKYITFKSDGTFVSLWTKSIYVGSSQISIGKITQKGNFKVNNGKITTTNVKESFKKIRSGYGSDYNNKAVKLLVMPYKFLDNNGLRIDNLRYSGDEAYYFQKY